MMYRLRENNNSAIVISNEVQRSEKAVSFEQQISPSGRNDDYCYHVILSGTKCSEESPNCNHEISPFGRNDGLKAVVILNETKCSEESLSYYDEISLFDRNDAPMINVILPVISNGAARSEKSPNYRYDHNIDESYAKRPRFASIICSLWLRPLCLFVFFVSLWLISNSQTRKTISLNDNWQTVLVDSTFNGGLKYKPKYLSEVRQINIPHNRDDYYGYRRLSHGNLHASALYTKPFSIKKENGKRYFLFFEGVGSYATVWVNGNLMGSHAGGRTTFTIDVTNALSPNERNYLAVRADHPAFIKNLPWVCGGCSDERGFSEGSQPLGIFRPVSLIVTNDIKIEPFGIHAWADVKPKRALLNIDATIKNYGLQKSNNISIIQSVFDKQNKLVAHATKGYHLRGSDSVTIQNRDIEINNPILWSVENPYLYKIKTTVKLGNKILDEVTTDFGFRTIQWKTPTNQFLLNGKPVFINGIAEYEHLIGQSHAFSDKQVLSRMKWQESAGFNAFRDGHQPHNLLYGKYFNEHGILWWTQMSAHIWYDTQEFRENFKKLLRDWVIERRNDPSVVMWGLQNESKLPKEFAEECTKLIRELDLTASTQRLVTTCNGGEGTDWDVPQNWTGTYGGDPDTYGEDLKKQILVGEYGAWRTLDLHTEGGFVQNSPVSEDRFTQLMEKKIRLAESVKDSVAGHYFWLLTSHDNPGRVQGGEGFREIDRVGPVNYKGMLTPWEEPTDVYYMFRSNYVSARKEPMVYIASHTWPNRWLKPGIKDSIHVYSNCDEVELFNDINGYSLGKKKKGGIGTHFIWDKVNIQYNVLYAVGYVNGKPVARDTIVLHHLPKAPNFEKLYSGSKNILQPSPGYNYLYRINCGGPDYTDENGNVWSADKALTNKSGSSNLPPQGALRGASSWTNNFSEMPATFASQRRTFSPIKGTKDWPLFQSFRYGKHQLAYKFPLPDGEYLVELYFTEPWLSVGGGLNARNMRLFDVSINQKIGLKDFDIWKEAGTNNAIKKVVTAKVTGGTMIIEFPQTKAGQAIISAIAIASKKTGIKTNPSLENVFNLGCGNCKLQSWADIGDKQFADDKIQINSLPPNLFGADWLQFTKENNKAASFEVVFDSDIFIGVKPGADNDFVKGFENTGTTVVTDKNGGTTYNMYKKRYPQQSKINISAGSPIMIFVNPASNMQPAYDLKPTTSYKADVAIMSDGVVKEMIANNERSVVKTNNPVLIEWPVKTGVADIYSITLKYFWPLEKELNGKLELIDVSDKILMSENISLKSTRDGKWNLTTVNTGGMINAGNYRVRLSMRDANGLVVSNIDVQ